MTLQCFPSRYFGSNFRFIFCKTLSYGQEAILPVVVVSECLLFF